jgi:hypothetical protein
MIRKLLTLLFALSASSVVFAQQNWGGGVDSDQIHFGFTFQYVSAEYKIYKKSNWRDPRFDDQRQQNSVVTDELVSISSPVSQGFGLGFVSDYKMGDHANLRFTPGLVFSDRLLSYQFEDGPNTAAYFGGEPFFQQKVQSTVVDLPLGIKLKSDRRNNFRAYMLGGVKYSLDIVSKKKTDNTDREVTAKLVSNKRNILSYEAGIGFDLYFEFFKLSPELKLSNSFHSVLTPEDHPFSSPLDKLFLRNLQFSLYFE